MVVFWASLVVATESPRVAVGHPVGREGVPRECMTSHARPWASHVCGQASRVAVDTLIPE